MHPHSAMKVQWNTIIIMQYNDNNGQQQLQQITMITIHVYNEYTIVKQQKAHQYNGQQCIAMNINNEYTMNMA